METLITFLLGTKYLWQSVGILLASWVAMQPIRFVFQRLAERNPNHVFFFLVNYLISSGMIFYVWPGTIVEAAIASAVLGFFVPRVNRIILTGVGKKWPWVRTIMTGERKDYEEDIISGEDVTVWLGSKAVDKLIAEKMAAKAATEKAEKELAEKVEEADDDDDTVRSDDDSKEGSNS